MPGPFIEHCTSLFIEWDRAFVAELSDRDFEPGSVVGVVEQAIKFKVEKFSEADSGPAENLDCEATCDVRELLDCCHKVTVLVRWQRSGDGFVEAWKVASMDQWSAWPFRPFP